MNVVCSSELLSLRPPYQPHSSMRPLHIFRVLLVLGSLGGFNGAAGK
jgi:hypothetical protein